MLFVYLKLTSWFFFSKNLTLRKNEDGSYLSPRRGKKQEKRGTTARSK